MIVLSLDLLECRLGLMGLAAQHPTPNARSRRSAARGSAARARAASVEARSRTTSSRILRVLLCVISKLHGFGIYSTAQSRLERAEVDILGGTGSHPGRLGPIINHPALTKAATCKHFPRIRHSNIIFTSKLFSLPTGTKHTRVARRHTTTTKLRAAPSPLSLHTQLIASTNQRSSKSLPTAAP